MTPMVGFGWILFQEECNEVEWRDPALYGSIVFKVEREMIQAKGWIVQMYLLMSVG